MPRKSNDKPSFFKVVINMEFTKLLRLPPAFLRKYDLNLPEKVKLRVHSGRKWKVKLQKMESNGGVFCFTKGWPKFAEEISLKMGEFLVFTLIAESEFVVDIYDTSFCEREIPLSHDSSAALNPHGSRVKKKKRSRARNGVVGGVRGPLYFETRLKRHHVSRLNLPNFFSRGTRMNERKEVKVEYVSNKYCEIIVVDPRRWTIDLAKGWSKFRKVNRLAYGKTYSFEFKPNVNAIHVKKVKKLKSS